MSGEQSGPQSGPQLVEVQIDQEHHTHRGVAIPPGATITVSQDTARWLEEQKIGHRLPAGSARRPAPPSKPATTDEGR
jgi:hypothetical protein